MVDKQKRRVVVLGMHRSGTSAVTRILNLLGLALCRQEDLYTEWDNPAGHWESRSLIRMNERILRVCGGTWQRPPRLDPGWEKHDRVERLRGEARATFAMAYPSDEWVWKDPRTSLTFPFWQPLIGAAAVLLVLRDPAAVAASLEHRDLLRSRVAAGLWERYMRSAMQVSAGLPVVVVRFDELIGDPAAGVAKLVRDFARVGVPLVGDQALACGSIKLELASRVDGHIKLTRAQRRLVEVTDALPEVSSSFRTPRLPAESLRLRWMFAARWRALARGGAGRAPASRLA